MTDLSEVQRNCLDLRDPRGALDHIINAKDYLKNVNPAIAESLGVVETKYQLLALEKEFARQISESQRYPSKTGIGKHYPG